MHRLQAIDRIFEQQSAWATGQATSESTRPTTPSRDPERLVVIGGSTGSGGTGRLDVEMFDGTLWSQAQPVNVHRENSGAVVYQGRIYLVGGLDANENIMSSVEVFNGSLGYGSLSH